MLRQLYFIFSINILTLLLVIPCSLANELKHFMYRDCFDKYFKQYTVQYFGPHFDWLYFKAQAIAESRLHPEARSPKGALGLMQILPSTFQEIALKNEEIQGQIIEPRSNIAAGISYNRRLWDEWSADRAFKDRLNFMFASYNSGKGNILQAQQLAVEKGLNPYVWTSIVRTLPAVTGDSSRETIAYVDRVHKIKNVLHIKALSQGRQIAWSVSGHWKRIIRVFPYPSNRGPSGDEFKVQEASTGLKAYGGSQRISGRGMLNP